MRSTTRTRTLVPLALVGALALSACGGSDDSSDDAADASDDASSDADSDESDSGDADSGDADSGDAESGDAGAMAEGAPECSVGQTDGDLALYNWSEYIDPELKTKFEEEFGVKVTEDNYDSNEAMQPVIQAGGSGYDVIVPSDYMVSVMRDAGNLMPLNAAALPNLANLDDAFVSPPYDPDNVYTAAYQWGTTGLGINLSVTGEDAPQSWGLIFDAEMRSQYNLDGQITMLNDPRETLGAALYYLGYSINTTSEDELNEARDLVAEAKDGLLAFDSDQYDELLASGDSALAHGFSGNMIVSIDESENPDDFAYFVPEEGATRWIDNMAIAFDSPHPCTAHAFINFILDAENGATLSNWNYYASPNAASTEFLDPELLADERVYPAEGANLEIIKDTGEFEINFSDAFNQARG